MNRVMTCLAAFGALLALMATPAKATLLTGDTVVEVTFDLQTAGLTPTLLGATSATPQGFLNFPITGGDLSAGMIEHDGSGVRLSAGSVFIDLQNFLIDITTPANSIISADVTTSGGLMTNAPIFTFDLTSVTDFTDLTDPSLDLFFTLTASTVLADLFGLGAANVLEGVKFGEAATAPAEIPLPAAAWLFIAGAGALATRARRRAAST